MQPCQPPTVIYLFGGNGFLSSRNAADFMQDYQHWSVTENSYYRSVHTRGGEFGIAQRVVA
jgi:hypothetical protein